MHIGKNRCKSDSLNWKNYLKTQFLKRMERLRATNMISIILLRLQKKALGGEKLLYEDPPVSYLLRLQNCSRFGVLCRLCSMFVKLIQRKICRMHIGFNNVCTSAIYTSNITSQLFLINDDSSMQHN